VKNMKQTMAKISIQGMSCGHCVKRVTDILNNLNGVRDAKVSLEQAEASFTFSPDKISLAAIREAIAQAGYDVGPSEKAAVEPNIEEAKPPVAARESAQFKVAGMTCANCALTIEKKLYKTPGVQSATVNFAAETVTVTYNPDQISLAELFHVVQEAGYKPLREETAVEEERTLALQKKWLILMLT
jgi:Cu+-exporting ATPase